MFSLFIVVTDMPEHYQKLCAGIVPIRIYPAPAAPLHPLPSILPGAPLGIGNTFAVPEEMSSSVPGVASNVPRMVMTAEVSGLVHRCQMFLNSLLSMSSQPEHAAAAPRVRSIIQDLIACLSFNVL